MGVVGGCLFVFKRLLFKFVIYSCLPILVPSKPLDLKAVDVTRNTISVTWQTPQYPNGKIIQYSVSLGNKMFTTLHKYQNGRNNDVHLAQPFIIRTGP